MQPAMNEKKNEWADKGQNVVDKAISQVRNIDPDEIRRTATELGTRVRDVSNDAYDQTIGYIRRNPVGAAFGLCAIGFFAGLITGMVRKSA